MTQWPPVPGFPPSAFFARSAASTRALARTAQLSHQRQNMAFTRKNITLSVLLIMLIPCAGVDNQLRPPTCATSRSIPHIALRGVSPGSIHPFGSPVFETLL
jgi:hypothetical protein